MPADQVITNGELIKLAAVGATLVSILVTISLFTIRELIERNRIRKKSATMLVMYAQITRRSLDRNSNLELPFAMSDMISNCEAILDNDSAAALFSCIEEALFEKLSTEKVGQSLTSTQRNDLSSMLTASLAKVVSCFKINLLS